MNTLIKPTININGTSKDELLEQYCNILDGIRALMETMRKATPNGRDYQTESPEVYKAARDAFNDRYNSLNAMYLEFQEIAEEIA